VRTTLAATGRPASTSGARPGELMSKQDDLCLTYYVAHVHALAACVEDGEFGAVV
jgi:hypothetical protein